jgi:uncharacterized SAM-dependent methyltransferase
MANQVAVNRGSRKVEHLLGLIEKSRQPNVYIAIDISEKSLSQNLAFLSQKHTHVRCLGLRGTFSAAHTWCENNVPHPRVFLSLGSVLFNDAWETALAHLRQWKSIMGADDLILAGMDGHTIPDDFNKIWASYHKDEELYTRFWKNGFRRANDLIGEECFRLEDWSVRGVIEEKPVSHRFVFRAKKSMSFRKLGISFRKGEDMEWFDAHKYPEEKVRLACSLVGLKVLKVWKLDSSEMSKYCRPPKRNETDYIFEQLSIL